MRNIAFFILPVLFIIASCATKPAADYTAKKGSTSNTVTTAIPEQKKSATNADTTRKMQPTHRPARAAIMKTETE